MILLNYQHAISKGNQNSYKFALGLSIIQLSKESSIIRYQDVAACFAEMYFRNHYRFKLHETSNPAQVPSVIQIIEHYFTERSGSDSSPSKLKKKMKNDLVSNLISPPGQHHPFYAYVLPCFQGASKNANGQYAYPVSGENDFFRYDLTTMTITLKDSFALSLQESRKAFEIITIYEWAKFLEKFNFSPNLLNKLSSSKSRRSLKPFQAFIKLADPDSLRVCSICRKPILNDAELSLDHVIPFDFVYTDELWNLLPSHKTCNSAKNARLGDEAQVEILAKRNRNLFDAIPLLDASNKRKGENMLTLKYVTSAKLEGIFHDLYDACLNSGFKVYSS